MKDMDQKISEAIKRMAGLARLDVGSEGIGRVIDKAKSVLDYVTMLNELATDGIEPTSHAVEVNAPLREDAAVQSGLSDDILKIAPRRKGSLVEVPKVIDEE